jgi:ABC-type multidrug transport system fused ATPase/permease subunit
MYKVVRNTKEIRRYIILYKRKSDFQQYFQDVRKRKTKLESTLISKSIIPKIVIETSFFLLTAIFVGFTINFDSTLIVDQNFLTFVFIIFRLMPVFSQISSQYSQFRLGVPSIKELGSLAASLPIAEKENKEEVENFNESLELLSASYRHQNASQDTLVSASIRVVKGEKVAIIGESGSGKSTLLDALMGIIDIESGEILIDGQALDAKRQKWAPRIAYVSQSFPNFELNIHQSIKFDFSLEKIELKQLRSLFLEVGLNHEDITKLLAQENQGNFLSQLSGGQVQRIAIARALFSDIEFVVLDEATSNLDSRTSRMVLSKFLNSNKTVIFVSHRASDLLGFDKIYEMKAGILIEKGA